jgi:hypothetical protein
MQTWKPEEVKAFELGYRSFINRTSIDINGYYNISIIIKLKCCYTIIWSSIDGGGLTNVEGQKRFMLLQMVTLELSIVHKYSFRD